jgi:hypothetical protein
MQLVKDLPIALLQSHDVAPLLLFTARVPCQKSEKERRREERMIQTSHMGEETWVRTRDKRERKNQN